jgi:XTP/dITP diphosphohydrolase
MTSFVLATANRHKAEEMRAVLSRLDIKVLARPDDVPEVDETEDSLEGNALLKAVALVDATGEAAIADDTGLFVDALDGRPGVFSARYAGEGASYHDNVVKLLGELESVAPAQRSAQFRTVIAVAYPDGEAFWVEGVLEGTITESPEGNGGFGYDPVFAPTDGDGRTLAQLTPDEKNQISHRARALRALTLEMIQR